MSDREKIQLTVGRLRATRRWQVVLEYLMRGLFWGALPAGLTILASRIWILPANEYLLAGVVLGAVAIGFIVTALFVRLTPLEVANDIDLALSLRERVSSALSLSAGKTASDPFIRTLVKDAADRVEGLPLKKVYPWRVPPVWKLALPALLIAAALSFVPQLNLFASDQDREEFKLVQDQGKELMELAKALEKEAEKRDDPVIKAQAQEIKRVGEKLSEERMNKKEALKEMQRLKDKLEAQAQSQIPAGDKKLMAELGEQLAKLDNTRELGEMIKEGDYQAMLKELAKLAADLAEGKMSQEQQEMLEDMVEALEETLGSEAASDPQAQEMKEQLEQLKESIQKDKELRDQMQQQLDDLEKDVDKLAQDMGKESMGQQGEQLQKQMEQLQKEMQQQGSPNPQSMEQMKQSLEQAQQSINNNQSLSPPAQQQLNQEAQKALDHFKPKESG